MTEEKVGRTPPERSRRGAWGIWVGVGVIAILAVSLFGFALDPGEAEIEEAPTGVMLDTEEDLGN
ncbi:hypothetical protein [Jannaschia sp. LMIT008]|uniref:hypothetical protein n=1 Tax=Jannaschia maritima TaxID=3032585 RepID=UPI0028125017|nr:hypothetical protein [Jannaschia sp. LMIT008]